MGNRFYNEAVDVWAIGLIAYELIHGCRLFTAESEIDLLINIFKHKGTPSFDTIEYIREFQNMDSNFRVNFPKLKKGTYQTISKREGPIPDDLNYLIDRLTEVDPRQRMTAEVAMKWLIKHGATL